MRRSTGVLIGTPACVRQAEGGREKSALEGIRHEGATTYFRVTVIIRLRSGVGRGAVEKLVAPELAKRGLTTEDDLKWIKVPSEQGPEWYVKFSTLVAAHQLDDAWNLRASRHFSRTGYGEVAWKITPVTDDDPDAEDTTCSVPEDLFRSGSEGADPVAHVAMGPREGFGSDVFWKWIDTIDSRICADDPAGNAPAAPIHPPLAGDLRIICAACYKERDAQGKWKQATAPRATYSDTGLSHGICPECARRLYPEYYPD